MKYTILSVVGLLQIFSLILATTNTAEAKEDWKFTGKFQPYALELATFDASFFELSCADRIDVMYENYARLHPQFRPYLGDAKMRKKWRYALVDGIKPNTDSFNNCIYYVLFSSWNGVLQIRKKLPLFCGKIVEGLNEVDQVAADALAEMTTYAMLGRSLPITTLIGATKGNKRVRLNDDIVYYLQLHLQKYLNEIPPIYESQAETFRRFLTPDAANALGPDRRKILNRAFANEEHLEVLAKTAPCQST